MRRTATVAGITLAVFLLTTKLGLPTGLLPGGHGVRPAVGTRQVFEVLVIVFQVVGVLTLAWLTLAPGSVRAEWGLMAAQFGLGVAGASCAGFESGFALYAGFTLVILLLGAIQTETDPHAVSHADAPRPRTVVVGQRLKLAGMRWGEDGADAVCYLRALYRSEKGQWEAFWKRDFSSN